MGRLVHDDDVTVACSGEEHEGETSEIVVVVLAPVPVAYLMPHFMAQFLPMRWRAHCRLCWARHPEVYATSIWWLPAPMVLTWDQVDAFAEEEPAFCFDCGGWRGPAQIVIWSGDVVPGEPGTLHCIPCVNDIDPADRPTGETWVDIGPVPTAEAARTQAPLGFARRQRFDGKQTANPASEAAP